MTDHVTLGAAPCEERCEQLMKHNDDYAPKAKAECRRYIEAIRQKLGPEPEGAHLHVHGSDHDYGRYYEACCMFEVGNEPALLYAYLCESEAPRTWDDVVPVEREKLLAECECCGQPAFCCEFKKQSA